MYYLTNIQLFQLVKSFPYHRTIGKTTKYIYLQVFSLPEIKYSSIGLILLSIALFQWLISNCLSHLITSRFPLNKSLKHSLNCF